MPQDPADDASAVARAPAHDEPCAVQTAEPGTRPAGATPRPGAGAPDAAEPGVARADPALQGLLAAITAQAGRPMARLVAIDGPRLKLIASLGGFGPDDIAPEHPEFRAWTCGGHLDTDDLNAEGLIAPTAWAARPRACSVLPLGFRGRLVALLALYDSRRTSLDPDRRQAIAPLVEATAELVGRRQQTQRTAREEHRLRDYARAAGDWLWEVDAQLRYRYLSPDFDRATGLEGAALIGHPLDDVPLLDELGRPLVDGRRLSHVFDQGLPFSRVFSHQRLGRQLRYLSRSGVPFFDADGVLLGWRGTTRDLTQRMQIGALAAAREQRLVKLAEQVPGVLFQYRREPDGRPSVPYVSNRVGDLFGLLPLQTAPNSANLDLPWHLLHEDDRAGFAQDFELSARDGTPLVREYRIRRTDGRVRWIEMRATPERQGDGAILWHGFAADITDRKRTELRLRHSEQQWELAAEANAIGLLSFDLDHGTIVLDRRACMIHGLDEEAAVLPTEDWLAAVDEAERDEVRAALQRALAQRNVFERRFSMLRPDGRRRLLEVAARGSYGADDLPIAMAATCRDVTEQAESERLRLEKDTAEQANRAKTEFLSRVSHELRTPLNGILGFTQLMALDALHRLPPAQRQRLDRVQAAGRHLLSLIEDMLELTRIERGATRLETSPVDLTRALARSLALIEPLAAQHSIGLPSPPVNACWVQADARALEQVLMNLLSNAIKYNRHGGSVGLTLGHDRDLAVLEVSDQGGGLTPRQQEDLFQPFNRLGAENRRIEGSGLGLVISRELARAMRGELRLASSSPRGSAFRLELPLTDSLPLELPDPAPPVPALPETGPRSLLYIEDEPLNVVLMEELVRARPQWQLHVAYDGGSGLALAMQLRPDLVLIDMNLPDTHGLSLIRRLREDPGTAGLQCIALSADAMQEQIERARAAGFDDYWTKPIDVTQMLAQLTRVLASRTGPA